MGMDTAHALNHAKIEDLPEYLRPIAEQGFSFSQFNKLIVYTDGSGLSNGQTGAKAGLGVFWGDRGRAYECNLHERVPGASQQTNNRGELLVSVILSLS
jgi:ribonuclease HI